MELKTATLSPRDHAPWFGQTDQNQKPIILRDLAGSPIVLIFYAKDEIPDCQKILFGFRDRFADFQSQQVKICSISTDSLTSRTEFAAEHSIPFSLLSNPDLSISSLYGAYEAINEKLGQYTYNRVIFLLDRNLRIVKIYSPTHMQSPADEILGDIKNLLPPEEPRQVFMQAPVLIIPNVFSATECQGLIDLWETEGHGESGFMKAENGKTVGYLDRSHKIRTDHVIQEGVIKKSIDSIIKQRIFPEIKKAFDYDANRREAYKISCYDANIGGFFRPHRDNTTGGTAHRKFAMTLNLNAGKYEGGFLRFPEYGNNLYKPETGSAVIFSCSLMHEATDVIAGRRFVLLSFFYGDREALERIDYEKNAQNDYQKVRVKNL